MVAIAPIAIGALQDYQRQRLFCFLDPYADAQGACYQLVQAVNAVGSGGLSGRGSPPAVRTSGAASGAEHRLHLHRGRRGARPRRRLLLLALFALLVWRILLIGWQARDTLGSMVAWGLAAMILFQVLVNVGMVIGIMPVTGVPLPFVTYGGSR